jgi:hypothetical protein
MSGKVGGSYERVDLTRMAWLPAPAHLVGLVLNAEILVAGALELLLGFRDGLFEVSIAREAFLLDFGLRNRQPRRS